MKKLGARNYLLISQAVKMFGTFNPDQIFSYFEESLYVDEFEKIYEFLKWVHQDEKNRSFGSGNYEKRFKEFLSIPGKDFVNPGENV